MKRTWRRVGVGTIAVLFIGYVGLVAVSLIALVVASANLTVFLGQVHVQRTGSAAAGLGHSGDQLQSGDVVKTAHDTKAAVGYPDGSLSRLDSDSTMQVKSIKGSNGVWNYQLLQSNGKVWSRVVALSRGSSFEIDAPNSTTVEVRGTEFEIIVDSSSGTTLTRVNSWRGAVNVAAQGRTVTVTGGQHRDGGRRTVEHRPRRGRPDRSRHDTCRGPNRRLRDIQLRGRRGPGRGAWGLRRLRGGRPAHWGADSRHGGRNHRPRDHALVAGYEVRALGHLAHRLQAPIYLGQATDYGRRSPGGEGSVGLRGASAGRQIAPTVLGGSFMAPAPGRDGLGRFGVQVLGRFARLRSEPADRLGPGER